jgi:hypothetical protein
MTEAKRPLFTGVVTIAGARAGRRAAAHRAPVAGRAGGWCRTVTRIVTPGGFAGCSVGHAVGSRVVSAEWEAGSLVRSGRCSGR